MAPAAAGANHADALTDHGSSEASTTNSNERLAAKYGEKF
jgi:hypothetical protein